MKPLYTGKALSLDEIIGMLKNQGLAIEDEEKARQIMQRDAEIDRLQKKIEQICFNLLIQQQPVAKDLRTVTAALKMVTDMERIGDHAYNFYEMSKDMKEKDLIELIKSSDL